MYVYRKQKGAENLAWRENAIEVVKEEKLPRVMFEMLKHYPVRNKIGTEPLMAP